MILLFFSWNQSSAQYSFATIHLVQKCPSQVYGQHPAPYILMREPCDLFWDLFWGVALTWFQWGRHPQTSPKYKSQGSLKRMYGAGCCWYNWLGHLWSRPPLVFPLATSRTLAVLAQNLRQTKSRSGENSVNPGWRIFGAQVLHAWSSWCPETASQWLQFS